MTYLHADFNPGDKVFWAAPEEPESFWDDQTEENVTLDILHGTVLTIQSGPYRQISHGGQIQIGDLWRVRENMALVLHGWNLQLVEDYEIFTHMTEEDERIANLPKAEFLY